MSKKKTNQTALNKCDELIVRLQELKKAITTVGSTMAPSNRKPVNGLGAGWSMDQSSGSLHHSTQGIISTFKHPEGHYQIQHGGRSVGRAANPAEAGAKIKSYVQGLKPGDTGQHNMDPMAMKSEGKDEPEEKSNRKGKKYSPEQEAALKEAKKLKKNFENGPWAGHGSVPNADEEVTKLKKTNPVDKAENLMANQLANLMQGRAMLGTPPPKQPTDQEMFGHLVPDEAALQKAEQDWHNRFDWLQEASKPIAQRFNSPEEEAAYWASIKVSDRDDGKSGY